jgi:hypothetical protein
LRQFKEECHLLSLAQDVTVAHAAVVKGFSKIADMFGSAHRQHLLVAFRHLDETLADVLHGLGAPTGSPLFSRLHDDVDPAARAHAAQAIGAIRDEVRAFMARHAMQTSAPDLGATHAARARLDLAVVSASELGPRHLRGYGELTDEEAEELAGLSERLREDLIGVLAALPEPPHRG